MKAKVLFLSYLLAFGGESTAQRSIKSPVSEKVFFEIIGGPTFVKHLDNSRPSFNYRLGGVVVLNFKRSYLQAGLEYLTASGKSSYREFKFYNHVAGLSVMSQLRIPKASAISLDLGAFYGFTFYHWNNYVFAPCHTCSSSDQINLIGSPVNNKTHLQLRAGVSGRLPGRFSISVTGLLGGPTGSYDPNDDVHEQVYYMILSAVGYRL